LQGVLRVASQPRHPLNHGCAVLALNLELLQGRRQLWVALSDSELGHLREDLLDFPAPGLESLDRLPAR
jgi:hypothetical protein